MGWKKCYLISGIAGVILGFNLQVEMIFSVANTTAHELELKFYRGQPDALKLLLCIGSRKDQIIKVYCTRAVSLISAWGCSRGLNLWPLSHIATTLPVTPRLPSRLAYLSTVSRLEEVPSDGVAVRFLVLYFRHWQNVLLGVLNMHLHWASRLKWVLAFIHTDFMLMLCHIKP